MATPVATGVVVGQPVAAQPYEWTAVRKAVVDANGQPYEPHSLRKAVVDANGQPYEPLITGQFSSGECDCCGQQNSCFMACCCSCFTFAGIVTRAQIPVVCNTSMKFCNSLCFFIVLMVIMHTIQQFVDLFLVEMIFGKHCVEFDVCAGQYKKGQGQEYAQGLSQITEFVLGFIFAYFIWDLRSKFRAKFSIPGSDCADLMCGWCCMCCTLAQMDRHLALNDKKCECSDQGPHPGLAALEAGEQPLQPQAL
jgi:Cys-rich protein (TIGR01571 family)